MSTAALFSPDIEELLEQLACEPSSRLLRVPRARVLPGFLQRVPAASSCAAGLTHAERHLLDVHRARIGVLLRERCVAASFEEPGSTLLLHRHLTVDRELEVKTDDAWAGRAEQELAAHSAHGEVQLGRDLLGRCLGADRHESPSVAQLAAASLRIDPTDEARVYSAMDLLRRGYAAEARQILEDVLEQAPPPLLASIVLENLGVVHNAVGQLGPALLAYRASAAACDERPGPLIGWLFHALQLGDRKQALDGAARLDELVPNGHACVEWFHASFTERRRRGEWLPTHSGVVLAGKLRDRLGRASRRVTDVL